jgi:hypothetical protein
MRPSVLALGAEGGSFFDAHVTAGTDTDLQFAISHRLEVNP